MWELQHGFIKNKNHIPLRVVAQRGDRWSESYCLLSHLAFFPCTNEDWEGPSQSLWNTHCPINTQTVNGMPAVGETTKTAKEELHYGTRGYWWERRLDHLFFFSMPRDSKSHIPESRYSMMLMRKNVLGHAQTLMSRLHRKKSQEENTLILWVKLIHYYFYVAVDKTCLLPTIAQPYTQRGIQQPLRLNWRLHGWLLRLHSCNFLHKSPWKSRFLL